MVSEALISLREARLALQSQLAQRQEYRALLIVDRAARQIAEILDPWTSPAALLPENFAREEPAPAALTVATREAVAEVEPSEDRVGEASIKTTGAVDEAPSTLSSIECIEDRALAAPAPQQTSVEESIATASRAIDLFLSSTAQAAPASAAPPRRRSYLPFVAAPQLQSAGVN